MSEQKFHNWRKATRSGTGNGGCVEVAFAADGTVGVRDSKDANSPVLQFTPYEWECFTGGVHDGEFEHPRTH